VSRIRDALQKVDKQAAYGWAEKNSDDFVATDVAELPAPARQIGTQCDAEADLQYTDFPHVSAERFGRVVFHTDPGSPAADRFRLLRMRLRNLSTAANLRSILITSALPEDGKTTVALNLATALAEHGKRRVLLIDADMHQGSAPEQLGLKREIGLKECLHDHINPLSVIRRIEPFGWHLLQAGMLRVLNPTDLLRPQELSDVFRKLSARFDWILVDSPPVLLLTDGIALSQAVDGILVVARADRTSGKAVEDAIKLLGRKHMVGLVLNAVSTAGQPYSAYQKYYRSNQSLPAETAAAADTAQSPSAGGDYIQLKLS
jgi:capsular exopolysaccharide synthesis family protein